MYKLKSCLSVILGGAIIFLSWGSIAAYNNEWGQMVAFVLLGQGFLSFGVSIINAMINEGKKPTILR